MRLGVLILLLSCAATLAADLSPSVAGRQWRETHERSILDEFFDLLRIPNTGQDLYYMRRNAQEVVKILEKRGVATQLLEVDDAPPVVYGELVAPEATQTLLFYAHYDGQPVEPTKWVTGDPFRPTLMSGPLVEGGRPIPLPSPGWPTDGDWRIYARSAGDDKAPIIAIAVALDALKNRGIPIQSNIKFYFEGEEERGSPHMEKVLREHRDLLTADAWLLCDGPVHQNRRQQVAFGARGITGLDLTVYGPRRALHSGHYGNWAPNPAVMLARLLASMKDEDGRVLVKGFYDDIVPLNEVEQAAVAEAPNYDAALKRELWLAATEGEDRRLEAAINLPSLNIRGLSSEAVGADARNVIPAAARASLDIRLVKGMDHKTTLQRVIDHIREQGFHVSEVEPGEEVRTTFPRICKIVRESGYNAVRTPMDLDISQRVIAALERARGPIVKLPTLGGSLPLYAIDEILGAPAIIVPIANHDNNQHAPNENIRLQNLWDGIETMAALIAMEDGREPPVESDGHPQSAQ